MSVVLALALASTASPTAPSPAVIACPTNQPLARLVRESDTIILARPFVSIQRLNAAMRETSRPYLDIPLIDPAVLKGDVDATPIVLKYYPEETTYAPSPKMLTRLSKRPALFFLTHVDRGSVGFYFHYDPEALQDGAPAAAEAVKAEVARQHRQLETWRRAPSPLHFDRVRSLLERLPSATQNGQQRVFQELASLGKEGVPAIIAQMDDRRALAFHEIALENHSPNAFESIRHYGPELVVDALDAVLNQITGYGATIVNGGSERQRRDAVVAWRTYAADLNCNLD